MSSSDESSAYNDFVTQFEKGTLDGILNSFILQAFLTGLYTMIFMGTMYASFTRRKASQSILVLGAIVLLYLLAMSSLAIFWYSIRLGFISNSLTLETIFYTEVGLPPWILIVSKCIFFLMFVLADGILVWRCFIMWSCSYKMIAPLLCLITAQAVLFLSSIGMEGIWLRNPSAHPNLAKAFVNTQVAAFYMSFGTTLCATLLIAYRILSVSRGNKIIGNYRGIIEIVAESAAIYCIALLFAAVAEVLPTDSFNTVENSIFNYATAILIPVAGIAPTIIVGRVSFGLSGSKETWSRPAASILNFGSRGIPGAHAHTETSSMSHSENAHSEQTHPKTDGISLEDHQDVPHAMFNGHIDEEKGFPEARVF